MTEKRFTIWFYAAAAYNLVWGVAAILFAKPGIDALGLTQYVSVPFMQVLGMMVGVYAYGYLLVARNPERYREFVWIGLIGKACGVTGFLFYALTSVLPWSMGWMILFNDVIWIPAFSAFLIQSAASRDLSESNTPESQ